MKVKRLITLIVCAILFTAQMGCGESSDVKATNTYTITNSHGEGGVDFVIDYNLDGDIKVLILADLQMQDLANARNGNRYNQLRNAFFSHGVYDHKRRVWQYVDEAVERATPDLIVLTGDNIYGETDDDGSDWKELCEKMDSYKTPWLCVFGNHDNESGKGVNWQIRQLEKTKYCVFYRGNVTGNSNYNVLVSQMGEPKYLFYMLDTNGCAIKEHNPGEALMPDNVDIEELMLSAGIFNNQLNWVTESYSAVKETHGDVESLMFYHIPPFEAWYSVAQAGDKYPMGTFFDDGVNFGIYKEAHSGFNIGNGFYSKAKSVNCKGMFVGHQHKIATSIVYDGIRLTYGLKTGTYDYHDRDMLGSTLLTIYNDGGFGVQYLFSQLQYIL